MSPKELLYIEDVLAHTKFMKQKCSYAAGQVTDTNLQQLINNVANKNQQIFDNVYSLVVGHAKGGA